MYTFIIKGLKETMEKVSIRRLYSNQNISIRKYIRQMDRDYTQNLTMNNGQTQNASPPYFNIAVVGPQSSGKTSLIKTINYALNGTTSNKVSPLNGIAPFLQIEKYQIKQSKKVQVVGVSSYHNFQDKIPISLFEYRLIKNTKTSVLQCYRKLTETVMNGRGLSPTKTYPNVNCIKDAINSRNPNPHGYAKKANKIFKSNQSNSTTLLDVKSNTVNYVIICCNMVDKIQAEELFALKCFINQLEDRSVPYTVVGSNIDRILDCSHQQQQQQKLTYIDAWKQYIIKQLNLKRSHDNIFCMQNYQLFEKDKMDNCEITNYYALILLQKIVKQTKQYYEKTPKAKKISKLLCFCS